MAKLASQTIAFQLFKAVSDNDSEELNVLSDDMLEQLTEAISELTNGEGVVVELIV